MFKVGLQKGFSKVVDKILTYPFLGLSIISFFIIVILGLGIISDIYATPYPYSAERNDSDYKSEIVCNSLHGYDIPVSGDFFSCNVRVVDNNITDEKNLDSLAYMPHMTAIHYPGGEWIGKEVGHGGRTIKENVLTVGDIRVPISNPGFSEFYLTFETPNYVGIKPWIVSTSFVRYTSISLEEYNKRGPEKNALILSLFGLAFTVSLVGIKNLMEIWDRETKKR